MAGWFRGFLMKPKKSAKASESGLSRASQYSPSPRAVRSSNSSAGCSSKDSSGQVPSAPLVCSSDSARWSKPYDVCICHNKDDLELVEELLSYMEGQPEHFRCFLQLRDSIPGRAIVTELCDAVQNSHCWVLLITPNFLEDPWCRYQMHHALMEAPMANGRIIPVLKDIERRDYPRELRCLYYITFTLQENSFRQIKEAMIRYFQDLCQNASSRN
ncbi:toll/interleukin-1 receptor domain-containing adapter protein [Hemicordylus capensis]|uniref:toll/interleukin-1 receptor domain-containing adapter protein n=1 Tax=Hemicordylus capensis TaxID=884348 RepID=UPI002304136E|nr:toll/interleukin-1 receptor domain-containing adapter protein [Hemicordylus capensis]XP_053126247.1 toll/interleukin-1 receptor domain-containing adapter protein [Hemicordylus capensis]XP_053126248.1 toll/interleukin-1 receptor domain-containing adapter protein [Hemicordylus capensis]XP_053126250.1 toll/interleukin-1 receptor domain-containing adapter protein [Hemicordylus capensis]XP_053126251.1 toll/interleukin-1 receptor domain-containing adapter protein [Hemicordylus capensis]